MTNGVPQPTRFSVLSANVDAAIAHLTERGFRPSSVERGEGGMAALVFAGVPENRMHLLAQALPVHLGAKIGIVVGNQDSFQPEPSPRP